MNPKIDANFLRQFHNLEEMKREAMAEKLRIATPRRASRLTKPIDCVRCGKRIQVGELYRNGGLHNRAHERCMEMTP